MNSIADARCGAAARSAIPMYLVASMSPGMRPARPRRSSPRVVSSSGSVPPASNHSTMRAVSNVSSKRLKDVGDRGANQLAADGVGPAQLAFVFELELAGNGWQRGVNIRDPCHRRHFAGHQRATLRVRCDVLQNADRQALTHARALVDAAIRSRLKRDLLDDFANP